VVAGSTPDAGRRFSRCYDAGVVVLGIDPGSRRCGYGVVARSGGRLARLESGVIVLGSGVMAERLAALLDALDAVLGRCRVDAVAVETAFCGLSPRSALALGQSRGIALAAAARAGLPVYEYAPAEVKRSFTGSGRAEKAQMVRTARVLFGLAARLPDEADALAIAVCHLARRLVPRGGLGSGSRRAGGSAAGTAIGESERGATLEASGRRALRPAVRRFAEMP
jgi:crossover junction endodeoxyribonuclease RuvC